MTFSGLQTAKLFWKWISILQCPSDLFYSSFLRERSSRSAAIRAKERHEKHERISKCKGLKAWLLLHQGVKIAIKGTVCITRIINVAIEGKKRRSICLPFCWTHSVAEACSHERSWNFIDNYRRQSTVGPVRSRYSAAGGINSTWFAT